MDEKSVQTTLRKAPKLFMKKLTTSLEHYNNNSDFQVTALKIFIVLLSLVLHKPSKNKHHCLRVEKRMKLLQNGRIIDIIKDCTFI